MLNPFEQTSIAFNIYFDAKIVTHQIGFPNNRMRDRLLKAKSILQPKC